jgi:hypothetical protein
MRGHRAGTSRSGAFCFPTAPEFTLKGRLGFKTLSCGGSWLSSVLLARCDDDHLRLGATGNDIRRDSQMPLQRDTQGDFGDQPGIRLKYSFASASVTRRR